MVSEFVEEAKSEVRIVPIFPIELIGKFRFRLFQLLQVLCGLFLGKYIDRCHKSLLVVLIDL